MGIRNGSSVLESPIKYFDQRLSSELSQTPLSPIRFTRKLKVATGSNLQDTISNSSTLTHLLSNDRYPILDWMKLSKIGETLNSASFKEEKGTPAYITVSESYIAIATSKRFIALFGYNQTLLLTIEPKDIDPNVEITTVALSIDSTYLAAGYSNGHINLWELKKPEPIISIRPRTLEELQFNGRHYHISHYENTPVRKILFLGSRHTAFVSSDDAGMLFFHNGGRSLIGYYCRSTILYGEYKTLTISKSDRDKATLLDFDMLPVGSNPLITDNMGVLSIITPEKVIIFSLLPAIKSHFEIHNTNTESITNKISAHIEWFPSITDSENGGAVDASLAFCWSNDLQIVRIKPTTILFEGNNNEIAISYRMDASIATDEPTVSLRWLNHRIIMTLTNSQKLLLLDSSNLQLAEEKDLMTKNIKYLRMVKETGMHLIEKSYNGSICTFKSSIFMFQGKDIMICRLNNWADILLQMLNDKNYIGALECAKKQYKGDVSLALLGLPGDTKRQSIMRPYLEEILRSSLKYIFTPEYDAFINIESRLDLFFDIAMMLDSAEDIYDMVYEALLKSKLEKHFFESIQEHILTGQKLTFSPTILKAMISYYVAEDDIITLEKLICQLDIEKLDIDLVVLLCKKYQLNETLTYIWTSLLKDYVTPLNEAVQRIRKLNEEYNNLSDQEKNSAVKNIQYVYPFLCYTLTGRQYPTDKYLSEDEARNAKVTLYKALFDGKVSDATKNIFSDLFILLKFDSASMFSCLNECFEDNFLNSFQTSNDDFQINRQYIVDILFVLFNDTSKQFSLLDQIRFAIFISRNYPKYPQFIRLSDTMADDIISLLCSAKQLEETETSQLLLKDCELGLQSLLSIYKPIDTEILLLKLEKVGFFRVLMSLYQSEERYYDALKLWIRIQSLEKLETDLFNRPVSAIIQHELKTGEKSRMIKLLNDNLELFAKADLKNIASIICSICPEMNSEVVKFKDSRLKFEYLKTIFNLTGKGESVKIVIDEKLQLEFLQDLINQRNSINSILAKYSLAGEEEINKSTKSKKKKLDEKIKNFVFNQAKLDEKMIEVLKINDYALLADWFVSRNEFQKSATIILDIFVETSKNFISFGYTEEQDMRLWGLLELYFDILSSTNLALKVMIGDVTLKESLLLQIIEATVDELALALENENVEKKIRNTFKRIIQSTFQFIIDLSRDDSLLFSTIFKKFLDRPSTYETRLGDVKFVLKELFMSYSNTKQILDIIQALINEDIFKDIQTLDSLKLKGRSPRNIECETCGKKVWGGRVGNKVYEYWRQYKLQEMFDKEETLEDGIGDLIIFKCKHAYHKKCVENMGMKDDENKECIVCKNA